MVNGKTVNHTTSEASDEVHLYVVLATNLLLFRESREPRDLRGANVGGEIPIDGSDQAGEP